MRALLDTNVLLNSFGKRLTAVRKAKHLTLRQAADAVGTSVQSFSAWANDKSTPKNTSQLFKFCELTEITLDWLVNGKGPPPPFIDGSVLANATAHVPATEIVDTLGSMEVPQISGHLPEHRTGLRMQARAHWSIPREVIEFAFHGSRDQCVMMRITSTDKEFKSGDYVLIDAARTVIDGPGIYLVATEHGAARASVDYVDGRLRTARLDTGEIICDPQPLGRIIGVFHSLM